MESRKKQKGNDAFVGRGNIAGEAGEIQELKRKVALLEQEREILKKAVAIFAQVK
jgi:transposase